MSSEVYLSCRISPLIISSNNTDRLTLSFMSDRRIKVILVDDHHIVLDGLESLLQQEPEFHVLASLRSGEEAFEMLKTQQPNILLTDFSLPGISGVDFVRQVRRLYPQVKIIVLSMHDEGHIIKSV